MDLWHALNRGVEGRNLFRDSQDYARFVHDLYEFNNSVPSQNSLRAFVHSDEKDLRKSSRSQERELLVNIHGWVLMKDHYHLLLSERKEGGLSLFLRKLNVGYANYINERYKRKGTLFQGRTKKILIEKNAHFLYILHYIHLNPLDYLEGAEKWRIRSKSGIQNINRALEHLNSYRWSSYLDYIGKNNFPSILTTSLFIGALSNYQNSLNEYLQDAEYDSDNEVTKIILE